MSSLHQFALSYDFGDLTRQSACFYSQISEADMVPLPHDLVIRFTSKYSERGTVTVSPTSPKKEEREAGVD